MLTPVLHRLLVKPDEVETKTAGGIILTVDPKKERLAVEKGVVISIGDTAFLDYTKDKEDKLTHPLPKVGDRVYYAKYAGKLIKDTDDVEYLILNDEDVIAVVT